MKVGRYDVNVEYKRYSVNLEDKNGDPFRMSINQILFGLVHESGDKIVFKRHRHAGTWKWSDSRIDGVCSSKHVVSEVARLLFRGNEHTTSRVCGLDGRAEL